MNTNNQQAVIVEPQGEHTSTVIWLHGLGADGHDFEQMLPALGLPTNHGIKFVFPHAPQRPVTINGGMVMRAWYDILEVNLRKQEDAEGIEASRMLLEGFIKAEREAGIPAKKILLAGFSQGGVVILHAGLRYSESLAGLLALSTYLALPDKLASEANSANESIPIFVAHGATDPVIPVQQGRDSAEQLTQAGYLVDWHEYPMEHSVSLEEIEDISRWLRAQLKIV